MESNSSHLKGPALLGRARSLIIPLLVLASIVMPGTAFPQTANGEIEGRAAPVARRKCVGGASAGALCNANGDCPGSTCVDRNVFTVSVAVQFNASASELAAIRTLISNASAILFDATDGQAEIGAAFIYNNAFGTGSDADIRIYPSTSPTWWQANTGNWQVGGSVHVSIDNVLAAGNGGESLAHELVHLIFDARDEYESRAAGCGAVSGGATCPDAAAIAAGAAQCLMDQGGLAGDHSEMCWGQGNPANLTDLSAGNHDATNVTEQSRCRSNRSCWAQVVWSWPNTFTAPTGAPDPAANGATVRPTNFVEPDNTARVVMVLDESGSMSSESPTRMSRLKVAALDFVAMAASGTELGIVSYSDDAAAASGRVNLAIAPLGASRTAWNNAVTGLTPSGWTNIGDGLRTARNMITTAGGVTANTFIVLMTDGINNRPSPQSAADADLDAEVAALLAAGIPVYVTCTGSDLGLSSQCAEIAAGTGGFYVDAADAGSLPEAFVDIHERTARRDMINSYSSWSKRGDGDLFYVEEGSESATFTLIWREEDGKAEMHMIAPDGTTHKSDIIPQGRYAYVKSPMPGEWKMVIDWSGSAPAHYVKRGYSRNPVHTLQAKPRFASVLPEEAMYLYAYPMSTGGSVTDTSARIRATVLRPDGSQDEIMLDDMGHLMTGGGDDIEGDGVFTGVYTRTDLKGDYQFLLHADIKGWRPTETAHLHKDEKGCPQFSREARLSIAVGDPKDVVKDPEDGKGERPQQPGDKDTKWWWYILLLILAFLLYWLWRRKRS